MGDSLAVGMAGPTRYLAAPAHVVVDARMGRPLAEGLPLIGRRPRLVVVSLFTNDDPRSWRALRAAVERVQVRRAGRCTVWLTVSRPRVAGASYRRANLVLRRHEGRWFRVVRWRRHVVEHPAAVGPDRVHATPAGYRWRARAALAAGRRCG